MPEGMPQPERSMDELKDMADENAEYKKSQTQSPEVEEFVQARNRGREIGIETEILQSRNEQAAAREKGDWGAFESAAQREEFSVGLTRGRPGDSARPDGTPQMVQEAKADAEAEGMEINLGDQTPDQPADTSETPQQ